MKRRILSALLFSLSGMLLLGGCKKEGENNDEEVITTIMMHFTPAGGGPMLMYSYDDPDGDGGNAPTIQDIVLQPNTTYNVSVEFLDKTKNPDLDITEEVEEEGEAHRIYFEPSTGSNITISNLDNDADGLPLGLNSTWTTGAAATGTVKVTLRHYGGNPPNKAANDDVNSNKSSTDAQAIFNTRLN
jgi:hypothetical protein